ncbi:phage/plasmid replication protein, II/X family [Vibrio vulnificus]|uniref:phage/plasmid replication protein, II/X family n=2 Tax=Vibrio vulnificus TaxID=672 RepID=UPI0019D4615B|nr:phage/plasmid replication protein, II/X family [Vibrio vulnificus]MBN8115007.1 replication protein [Vibrio vulnificus]
MYDFNEITVPFKSDFIIPLCGVGYVDFEKVSSVSGLKVSAGDAGFSIDGDAKPRDLYVPWSKLTSSYTDIACKVFDACPESNVTWGYFRFKASPAKVMQGHNVYGSDDLRLCVEYMIDVIRTAAPGLFDALDWGLAEFSRLDATYSIQFPDKDVLAQVIQALRNIRHRYLRPSNKFINKTNGNDLDATVYWSASTSENKDAGRAKELLFYTKEAELKNQLRELKSRARRDRTNRFDHVIAALSTHELQDFTANRGRFEGRAKKRYIKRMFGTCNVWAVIRHTEEFKAKNGYSFCEYLFKDLFSDLFEAVQGDEIEVFNEFKIKSTLYDTYKTITPKGNVSYSKADRIFKFYLSLCDRGYDYIKLITSKSTLNRNMKELTAIGLSKADLQNIQMGEKMKLSDLITFDFDNQRPADFKEPKSPFRTDDVNYLTNTVGYTSRLGHIVGLSENPEQYLINKLNLSSDFDITPLLTFNEVPVSPRESWSLVVWPDGEVKLLRHTQRKFKQNTLTQHFDFEHIVPEAHYLTPEFLKGNQTHAYH